MPFNYSTQLEAICREIEVWVANYIRLGWEIDIDAHRVDDQLSMLYECDILPQSPTYEDIKFGVLYMQYLWNKGRIFQIRTCYTYNK